MQHKIFCVCEFIKTESATAVQRAFRLRFNIQPPTRKSIRRWNQQFLILKYRRTKLSPSFGITLYSYIPPYFQFLLPQVFLSLFILFSVYLLLSFFTQTYMRAVFTFSSVFPLISFQYSSSILYAFTFFLPALFYFHFFLSYFLYSFFPHWLYYFNPFVRLSILLQFFNLIFQFLLFSIILFHFISFYSPFSSSAPSCIHVLFTFSPLAIYFSLLNSLTPRIYVNTHLFSFFIFYFPFSLFILFPNSLYFFIFYFQYLPFFPSLNLSVFCSLSLFAYPLFIYLIKRLIK